MASWCHQLETSILDAVTGLTDLSSPAKVLFGLVVVVGVLRVAYCTLAFLFGFLGSLAPKKSLRKYGSWAVVTGATDGIGFGTVTVSCVVVAGSPASFLLLLCFCIFQVASVWQPVRVPICFPCSPL
jgi:hypothetical protein